MCLTLRNAVTVLDHQDGRSSARGYTRTRHHIGNLGPGDWWFPGPDALPHTVTEVHHRDDRILLLDQYGGSYSHPADAVIPTAVPDPPMLMKASDNPSPDGAQRRPPGLHPGAATRAP